MYFFFIFCRSCKSFSHSHISCIQMSFLELILRTAQEISDVRSEYIKFIFGIFNFSDTSNMDNSFTWHGTCYIHCNAGKALLNCSITHAWHACNFQTAHQITQIAPACDKKMHTWLYTNELFSLKDIYSN